MTKDKYLMMVFIAFVSTKIFCELKTEAKIGKNIESLFQCFHRALDTQQREVAASQSEMAIISNTAKRMIGVL